MTCVKAFLRLSVRTLILILPAVLCVHAAWATATATTTTLTVSSKTVNNHPIQVLTATMSPTTATGLVSFYDGKALIGTGQIVVRGTTYTHGAAYLSAQLSPGSHNLKAVYTGTAGYAASTSALVAATVAGGNTNTTISSTGSASPYTLTGAVTGIGGSGPTGQVQFIDQTAGNAVLGSSQLTLPVSSKAWANAVNYSIYDTTDFNSPVQVVTADFNGDGILDLAVVDYSDGVSIHLGKGDGTFLPAKPFCLTGTPLAPCQFGSEPAGIAVGDFNGDGIPDLVMTAGDAYVALGKGDGTFQLPVKYVMVAQPTQVVPADLNRDGKADLVVSVYGGVSTLLGNGDGTFQPRNDIGLNSSSDYISIGDFNKDGIPDIVSAGWNGSNLMVLLGNGNGTFKPEIDTPIDINTASCQVQALDLKGSGYLQDVALCGSGTLEAMIGKGDGHFNAPQEMVPNGTFSEYVAGMTAADINGDGAVDLIMTWYSSDTDIGRVAVYTNKNDGTGTFAVTPKNYYVGQEPVSVIAGDFNGDGDLDIAVANQNTNNTSVLLDWGKPKATAALQNVSISGTGSHNVVAQYAGDNNYSGSTSAAIVLQGSGVTAPTITSLSPPSVAAGSGAFTLTVNGTGFDSGAMVDWNGIGLTTGFVSATQLTAPIAATNVAVPGTFHVTVVNSAGTSNPVTSNTVDFTVTTASVSPTLTSISPHYATAGSAALTMTVIGTNFVSGSVVQWGSAALTTTYVSATKVTAAVPATDLTTVGTTQVQVKNPDATLSNTLPFTVAPITHPPLAYGFFNKDGSAGARSGNLSCKWSTNEYLCTITGESFSYSQYVVNATIADINTIGFVSVNSITNQVIVKLFNSSGTAMQAPFYLVVFKP